VIGDPGEPGASLPVGDGIWILLGLVGGYTVLRFAFDSYQVRISC